VLHVRVGSTVAGPSEAYRDVCQRQPFARAASAAAFDICAEAEHQASSQAQKIEHGNVGSKVLAINSFPNHSLSFTFLLP